MHPLHKIFAVYFLASSMMLFFDKFVIYDEEDAQKHIISKLIKQEDSELEKEKKYIYNAK
jgi:hypothetical protein